MIFFLIFLIIPLIEVGLFAAVGEEVGVLNTLLLCVVTAMAGSYLVRRQGLDTLISARQSMDQHDVPINEIFDGLCLAVAGLLLITPGFFTDGVGFALLIPFVRHLLRGHILRYVQVRFMGGEMPPHFDDGAHHGSGRQSGVIDAEYEVVNKEDPSSDSDQIENKKGDDL